VEDLLLLTSGEKEMRLELVDLGVLIAEVLEENRLLAQNCEVTLHLESVHEETIPANGPLLVRAISNLVENGIRYNHPGGSVRIAVQRQEGWILIRISDTGIGIPSEELPHILRAILPGGQIT